VEILQLEDLDGAVRAARAVRRPAGLLSVEAEVKRIIERVREGGTAEVVALTKELDGADVSRSLEVGAEDRMTAWDGTGEEFKEAMRGARDRIALFAGKDAGKDWMEYASAGVETGQTFRPLDRAGIYVPGGRFAYPSTVLMTGVPAVVAGVANIVFCIPPLADGRVSALSLAATTLVEGARVFRVGGAQAIAAMAYGADPVPACPFIAGPGNAYVAEAKRQVSGDVRIDTLAGPSEVAVYIEDPGSARFAAFDMLSQLEHDPQALAVCVSISREALDAVAVELKKIGTGGGPDPEGRAMLALCAGRKDAFAFINELAPEHLELMAADARELLGLVESAGCVFLGPFAGVAFGDYLAGPSHVLPTGGAAVARGGLSARDFQKAVNVVSYDRAGAEADGPATIELARAEGLEMHARSVEERMKIQDIEDV
jgi:histidinol dehydrogenase